MDTDTRKTVLRMIPYGLYVLTASDSKGQMVASSISWVTQCSFEPPLLAVAVKKDSLTFDVVTNAQQFAINIIDKSQSDVAVKFFKHQEKENDSIAGIPIDTSKDIPILVDCMSSIYCEVKGSLNNGDHHLFQVEVKEVDLKKQGEGRPDSQCLLVKDVGDKMFYSG